MTEKPIKLEDKDVFTVNEVAAIIRVNRWTVLDYIYGGKLKAHKMGNGKGKKGKKRLWRIWRQDIIDFINSGDKGKESE